MGVQQILHQMTVATPGRGFTRLDGRLNTWILSTGLDQGVLHLTCLHTAPASLSSFHINIEQRLKTLH